MLMDRLEDDFVERKVQYFSAFSFCGFPEWKKKVEGWKVTRHMHCK